MIMAEKRNDSITVLIKETGVSRNSINKLWKDEEIDTLKLETLGKIYDSLNVKPSDLIEYIPDKQ